MKNLKRVAIIMAMHEEAKPIIAKFNLQEDSDVLNPALPMKTYRGESNGIELFVILNGTDFRYAVDNVGTVPAAISTQATITSINPDLIINAGTAGGFAQKGCSIGDIYLSTEQFLFHDRRIPLPKFEEYGMGSIPAYSYSKMAQLLNMKEGIISTGDSLDLTSIDLEKLQDSGADVKEMEAAAIAWVAWHYKKPLLAIKSITDLLDSPVPSQEQFMKNLRAASLNLTKAVVNVLNYFSNEEEMVMLA